MTVSFLPLGTLLGPVMAHVVYSLVGALGCESCQNQHGVTFVKSSQKHSVKPGGAERGDLTPDIKSCRQRPTEPGPCSEAATTSHKGTGPRASAGQPWAAATLASDPGNQR